MKLRSPPKPPISFDKVFCVSCWVPVMSLFLADWLRDNWLTDTQQANTQCHWNFVTPSFLITPWWRWGEEMMYRVSWSVLVKQNPISSLQIGWAVFLVCPGPLLFPLDWFLLGVTIPWNDIIYCHMRALLDDFMTISNLSLITSLTGLWRFIMLTYKIHSIICRYPCTYSLPIIILPCSRPLLENYDNLSYLPQGNAIDTHQFLVNLYKCTCFFSNCKIKKIMISKWCGFGFLFFWFFFNKSESKY